MLLASERLHPESGKLKTQLSNNEMTLITTFSKLTFLKHDKGMLSNAHLTIWNLEFESEFRSRSSKTNCLN